MEKKTCLSCGEEKPRSEFGLYSRNSDGLQSNCKSCKREYDRNFYAATSETRRTQTLEKKKRLHERNTRRLLDYLRSHHCVDCKESDPVVLEFDHVRGVKTENISTMLRNSWSWAKIEEEIAKCDVRCANCHRRVTYARLGGTWRNWV